MKILLLTVLLLVPIGVDAQTGKATNKPSSELTKLREEFIRLTTEYKVSLGRLLPFYESEVIRAGEKLDLSRKLLADRLIDAAQVEENELNFARAKQKLAETKRQINNAEQQVAGILNDAVLEQEFKKATQQRRKTRKPRCTNWTMSASQRTTSTSVSYSYRFICQN